jgi:hypothetical protein
MDHVAYDLPLPEELIIDILSYIDVNVPEFHKYKNRLFSIIDSFTRRQLLLFRSEFDERDFEYYAANHSKDKLRTTVKERFTKYDVENVHYIIKYIIPNFYETAKRFTLSWYEKHHIERRLQENFKNDLRSVRSIHYISRSQTVSAFLLTGFEYSNSLEFKAKRKTYGVRSSKALMDRLKQIEIK